VAVWAASLALLHSGSIAVGEAVRYAIHDRPGKI